MLYKTLDDVKKTAGFVAISHQDKDLGVLKEDLLAAENDVRTNYLGAGQFDSLDTQFNADAIVPDSVTEKLLNHTRRYVSLQALMTGAAKININYTKSGLTSTKSQTSVPAREWMLLQLKSSLLESACKHLDILLRFLEENRASFPLWTGDSSVSLIQRRFLVQSLPNFEKYYGLGGSFVTFKTLWPVIDHVQDRFLSKLLGQDFYDEIIAELNAGNLSALNTVLAEKFLKRLVVYKSIIRACEVLPVQVVHNGIVTNEFIASRETTTQQAKAELKAVELLKNQMIFDAQALIQDTIDYLNKTATDSIYATWFNSDLYDDPTDDDDEDFEINSEIKGFFSM